MTVVPELPGSHCAFALLTLECGLYCNEAHSYLASETKAFTTHFQMSNAQSIDGFWEALEWFEFCLVSSNLTIFVLSDRLFHSIWKKNIFLETVSALRNDVK